MNWYWLGEPFLYIFLALLLGTIILPRIHPNIQVPKMKMVWVVTGIIIFSFFPVLRIIVFFANDTNWFIIFRSVMLSFAEGKAYMWTLIFSILFMMMIFTKRQMSRVHTVALLLIAIGLIATLSWSSHSSSYFGMVGFWNHFIHLFSVTIWAGILMVAGRYMPNSADNWKAFLSWYHPFAVVVMIMILLSGLFLNFRTDPDYVNSWVTSYGQALLMKHLLIVPLLIMAFFNGFIMKRRIKNNAHFNPKTWLMAEGILILVIYIITGFLNQQPAPHELNPETMKLSASGLYNWFNQGGPILYPVQFHVQTFTVFMYLLALGTIIAMYVVLKQNKNVYAAVAFGVLFSLVSFVGFIHSVS
ncbi:MULTISPECIES: copper resistance D family protein [Paenibacillus]|uniref:Copper resistance protein D domain-containing protein n=2 Tax=Paenibacillus TaxID=44249 RepID=A0A7Y6BVC4_9BACL|nr:MULTISPECIES: CopD family protein [Paenibacillus]MDN4603815.1 CopD family protein [Paenibacillus vandeheii]NUU75688.1 hypothetical protein [Paenibacillus xylanilyticus]